MTVAPSGTFCKMHKLHSLVRSLALLLKLVIQKAIQYDISKKKKKKQ